jgi:hypothetical protein
MHCKDSTFSFAAAAGRTTLVTLAMAVCASFASADHLTSSTGSSGTSGISPTNRTLAKSYTENDAIYGVTIGEDSDEPCYLQVKYRDVGTGATQSSLTFNECDGHKVGDLKTAALPGGAHVTGVRICLNSDRDRLKGIQLIGGYSDCILGEESVTLSMPDCSNVVNLSGVEYRTCTTSGPSYRTMSCGLPLTSWVERPNCPGSKYNAPDNTWERVVSCPDKMVATGMKLRTTNGDGDRLGIDGVALDCRTLIEN